MTDKSTPPSRGTISEFDALHGALTEAYARELKRLKKAGEAPSPQFLSALQRFLAENGVNVPAHDKRFDRLKGALPNMDQFERGLNVVPIKTQESA